jgi:hypothetical protein
LVETPVTALVVTLISCNVQPDVALAAMPIKWRVSLSNCVVVGEFIGGKLLVLLVNVIAVLPSFTFLQPLAASYLPSIITFDGIFTLWVSV